MSPNTTATAWLQIHFCVLLWGFTAILGRLITLDALPLVWWRVVIVSLCLACYPRVWRSLAALPRPLWLIYGGIGVLVAAHWVTFYGAIKLANASVAATAVALGPVFLSVVEPWLGGRRFDARELLLALAVVPGIALIVGGIPDTMRLGLAVGVLSALLLAVFAALNKRFVTRADAVTVTALELGAGGVVLTVLGALIPGTTPFVQPDARDALLLLVLATACTLLPYALSLVALRRLSAFGATLAVNLEPVYAILLAMAIFGEHRDVAPRFYLGVGIIVVAVFSYPFLRQRSS